MVAPFLPEQLAPENGAGDLCLVPWGSMRTILFSILFNIHKNLLGGDIWSLKHAVIDMWMTHNSISPFFSSADTVVDVLRQVPVYRNRLVEHQQAEAKAKQDEDAA